MQEVWGGFLLSHFQFFCGALDRNFGLNRAIQCGNEAWTVGLKVVVTHVVLDCSNIAQWAAGRFCAEAQWVPPVASPMGGLSRTAAFTCITVLALAHLPETIHLWKMSRFRVRLPRCALWIYSCGLKKNAVSSSSDVFSLFLLLLLQLYMIAR